MSFDSRIERIEDTMDIINCPECERSMDPVGDDDQAIENFFQPCAKCGRQKTFAEMAEVAASCS